MSRQMSVWLWDAYGPGDFAGVSGNKERAREAAEEYLYNGQASTARVELAWLAIGIGLLTTSYRRAGIGWDGRRNADGVAWFPFAPALDQANRPLTGRPDGPRTARRTAEHRTLATKPGRTGKPWTTTCASACWP
jgi:hypothetical protein